MRRLRRVISGGQIGADIAGLRAAAECGIETGGHMPKGFRTKVGPRPDLESEYGVVETDSDRYPPRTALNVKNSDVTLRIAKNFDSPGEKLTAALCERMGRPCFDVGWDGEKFDVEPNVVASWLSPYETINVAGNALFELEGPAQWFLMDVFRVLIGEVTWL